MKTYCKGDWYRILLEDVEFITEEKNDEEIIKNTTNVNKKKMFTK